MSGKSNLLSDAVRAAAEESLDRANALRAQLTDGSALRDIGERPAGADLAALPGGIERSTGVEPDAWAESRRVIELVSKGDSPLSEGLPWSSAVAVRTYSEVCSPPPPWITVLIVDGVPPRFASRADLVVLPSVPDNAVWSLARAARSWLAAGGLLWSGCGLSSARVHEVLPALGFTRCDKADASQGSCWLLVDDAYVSGGRG